MGSLLVTSLAAVPVIRRGSPNERGLEYRGACGPACNAGLAQLVEQRFCNLAAPVVAYLNPYWSVPICWPIKTARRCPVLIFPALS